MAAATRAGSSPTPGRTGPHESGPDESGPHETGPHETGPNETGPHETGPHETGPHETGPHETGPHETGPHETGPHETGSPTMYVRDFYGRRYHVGAGARELTGHSRRRQLWSAWACMAAVSPLQYAFGLAALGLGAAHGWGQVATMWLFATFVVCQAGVMVPVAYLRVGRLASPAHLSVTGGVLAAIALVALGNSSSLLVAFLGYSVVGGVGAGLVYAAALSTAGRWYPDKRVAALGFVSGGFALGAVPTVALLAWFATAGGQALVLDAAAAAALALVVLFGRRLADPPVDWWPPVVDAQLWAVDRRLNPSLPHNLPAARSFAPGEAVRTGALPLMWAILCLVSAVSLFAVAFVASYAVHAHLGTTVAGVAVGLLAASNGLTRSVVGRLSDRFGRRAVLAAVLAVEGLAQLGLLACGESRVSVGFTVFALLAGVGGGSFYAIMGNLVLEYFGERSVWQNQALLYSAKAAGGLIGVGTAALLVASWGYPPVILGAGVTALVTAALVRLLRQPGRPCRRGWVPERPARQFDPGRYQR